MIFTLVTAVQEKLNEIVDQIKSRREEEKERKEIKEREAEEAEKVCCEHVPSECSVKLKMKSFIVTLRILTVLSCYSKFNKVNFILFQGHSKTGHGNTLITFNNICLARIHKHCAVNEAKFCHM